MSASLESEDGNIGFQIAPMIDVVFVLMLFFMAMTGAQQVEKSLPVDLPGKGTGHVSIVVEISDDGVVSMNGKVFGQAQDRSLSGLRQWFSELVTRFGDGDPVLLKPSGGARQERIVEVLNAVSAAGVKKLSFG